MAVFRLLLGFTKGAVIGGALGFGAYAAGLGASLGWLVYGLVGVAVGLLVGRPVWSHLRDKRSTIWVSIIKALFGFGVGAGLGALAGRLDLGLQLTIAGETRDLLAWPFLVGGAIGAVYGAWVEVDDSPAKAKKKAAEEAAEASS
jgi:uncharacterized membrane protein YfcA